MSLIVSLIIPCCCLLIMLAESWVCEIVVSKQATTEKTCLASLILFFLFFIVFIDLIPSMLLRELMSWLLLLRSIVINLRNSLTKQRLWEQWARTLECIIEISGATLFWSWLLVWFTFFFFLFLFFLSLAVNHLVQRAKLLRGKVSFLSMIRNLICLSFVI